MKRKIICGISILMVVGLGAQIVEKSLDKPAIQAFVEQHFEEVDDTDQDYDFKDESATTFWQRIGF